MVALCYLRKCSYSLMCAEVSGVSWCLQLTSKWYNQKWGAYVHIMQIWQIKNWIQVVGIWVLMYSLNFHNKEIKSLEDLKISFSCEVLNICWTLGSLKAVFYFYKCFIIEQILQNFFVVRHWRCSAESQFL